MSNSQHIVRVVSSEMVLSLVTDMLSGAPCSLDLLIDAEPNRKSTYLTKDRYVFVHCIRQGLFVLELVIGSRFSQMAKISAARLL